MGRTWAPRGARPVVSVRGAGGGRVSIAGAVCYPPGDRPRLFYQLLVCRRRKGEPKGFTWQDYRDLITATQRQLGAPVIWCGDYVARHSVSSVPGCVMWPVAAGGVCHRW